MHNILDQFKGIEQLNSKVFHCTNTGSWEGTSNESNGGLRELSAKKSNKKFIVELKLKILEKIYC